MANGEPTSTRKGASEGSRAQAPSRKLNMSSRLRVSFWRVVHRVLGTDALWSAALIVVVVLVLGLQRCGGEYEHVAVGQRATQDIKAFDDFEFVDADQTDEERKNAVDQVLGDG